MAHEKYAQPPVLHGRRRARDSPKACGLGGRRLWREAAAGRVLEPRRRPWSGGTGVNMQISFASAFFIVKCARSVLQMFFLLHAAGGGGVCECRIGRDERCVQDRFQSNSSEFQSDSSPDSSQMPTGPEPETR